jgi:hypothetical protein
VAGDGLFEYAECGGEPGLLIIVRGQGKRRGLGLGASQKEALSSEVMGLVIAKSAGPVKQRDVAEMAPPGAEIH